MRVVLGSYVGSSCFFGYDALFFKEKELFNNTERRDTSQGCITSTQRACAEFLTGFLLVDPSASTARGKASKYTERWLSVQPKSELVSRHTLQAAPELLLPISTAHNNHAHLNAAVVQNGARKIIASGNLHRCATGPQENGREVVAHLSRGISASPVIAQAKRAEPVLSPALVWPLRFWWAGR